MPAHDLWWFVVVISTQPTSSSDSSRQDERTFDGTGRHQLVAFHAPVIVVALYCCSMTVVACGLAYHGVPHGRMVLFAGGAFFVGEHVILWNIFGLSGVFLCRFEAYNMSCCPSARDNFLDDTTCKSYNDDIVCDLSKI